MSEKFTQGVREIHAGLARLSLSGICGILVFFVSLFMFPLTFPDFSVSPVLSFCISAAQWHVVIAPCVHILWKSGRSVTVIPRHDAESRRHPDGTHCTASGRGIQAKRQRTLHCGFFLDSAFQRNDDLTPRG